MNNDDRVFSFLLSYDKIPCFLILFVPSQRVENVGALPVTIPPENRRRVLEYRRAILLTIIGATNSDNPSLSSITLTFMNAVKTWLDDALANGK